MFSAPFSPARNPALSRSTEKPPGSSLRHGFHLALCCLALPCGENLYGAPEILDSIAKVRAISCEEAGRGLPVRIEGVVTYYDAELGALFVDDGSAGIYIDNSLLPSRSVHGGTRLRIEGKTDPGKYMPMVESSRIEILGEGPLPEPRRPKEAELLAPDLDGQWVEISGVVVGVESGDPFTLTVEIHGWTVKIVVLDGLAFADRAVALIHHRITVHAVAVNIHNEQFEMTGRFFCLPAFDGIVDSDPGKSKTESPFVGTDGLLRYGSSMSTRLRVRGTVTYANGSTIYLRDNAGGLEVRSGKVIHLTPGDHIEAEGFAGLAPFRPILRATHIEILGHLPPPEPAPLSTHDGWHGNEHATLVTVEADVLGRNDEENDTILHCRAENRFFEAVLPSRMAMPAGVGANCRVQLTGICELTTTHPLPLMSCVDMATLHLRNGGDVVVRQRPPWWTLRRILWAFGWVLAVALAALIWAALLRRTVAEQTQTIGRQIERAAIKDERERIARELHDTIEQGLAGVSLQLGNVREYLADTPEAAAAALDLARRMLRHCSEEARTSIRDLRSISLEQSGLHGALSDLLSTLTAECSARLSFKVHGEAYPLGSVAEHHLLRIAQESAANAVRHGMPRLVEVQLGYAPDSFTLQIRDDGSGFDQDAPVARGHFGLSGIRERANKLRAHITIESSLGSGTLVRLVIPVERLHRTGPADTILFKRT